MYILLNINRCNELPLENSFLKPLNFFLQNVQISGILHLNSVI